MVYFSYKFGQSRRNIFLSMTCQGPIDTNLLFGLFHNETSMARVTMHCTLMICERLAVAFSIIQVLHQFQIVGHFNFFLESNHFMFV